MISTCLKKHLSIDEQFKKIEKEFKGSFLTSIDISNISISNINTKDRFLYKIINKDLYKSLFDKHLERSINSLEIKKMINTDFIDGPTILKITNNKCENIFGNNFELKNNLESIQLFDTSMISLFGITTKTANKKSILFFDNGIQIFLFKRLSVYALFILKIN